MRLLLAFAAVFLGAAAKTEKSSAREGLLAALKGRIKHVVVLMEENRSFDHFFGWAGDLLNVEGLTGSEFNYYDTKDPAKGKFVVDDNVGMINDCDPSHTTPHTTEKIFGAAAVSAGDYSNATMGGFIEYEGLQAGHADENYCDVMSMMRPESVPVITGLAQEFAIMDRFFASHPGPTWPNRMFALSATSAGSTETSTWYRDRDGALFPQRTIFDQMDEAGLAWRNYYNDTPWELFMQSVAHNAENVRNMEEFWRDAREGTLPSFAWLNPRSGINVTTGVGSNDQHPTHDVAAGEQFYKDVYEALRASPQWNETLYVITMDEHGGFYDHVPTPLHGVPPPNDPFSAAGDSYPEKGFVWDRLGIRIPTLLISPWIDRGTVVSAPPAAQKPSPTSEYELTSILATARLLLDGETPRSHNEDGNEEAPRANKDAGFVPLLAQGSLTERDAWAATFEHVLLQRDEPRTDCPLFAPDAPQPTPPFASKEVSSSSSSPDHHHNAESYEATLPLNDLQEHISSVHAALRGGGGGGLGKVLLAEHAARRPQVQGEVSEWYRPLLEAHKERVAHWRRTKAVSPSSSPSSSSSKRSFEVVCQPIHFYKGHHLDDYGWEVNRAAAGSGVDYQTVSSKTLRATVWGASEGRGDAVLGWVAGLLATRSASGGAIGGEQRRDNAGRGPEGLWVAGREALDELEEVVPWCLDYSPPASSPPPPSSSSSSSSSSLHSTAAEEGSTVGVSACFPSEEPQWNQDLTQHWTIMPDATLRPFSNLDLCATNTVNEQREQAAAPNNRTHRSDVVLVACDGRLDQHFAWHGDAPGQMGNSGAIEFGDDTNAIGMIRARDFSSHSH